MAHKKAGGSTRNDAIQNPNGLASRRWQAAIREQLLYVSEVRATSRGKDRCWSRPYAGAGNR